MLTAWCIRYSKNRCTKWHFCNSASQITHNMYSNGENFEHVPVFVSWADKKSIFFFYLNAMTIKAHVHQSSYDHTLSNKFVLSSTLFFLSLMNIACFKKLLTNSTSYWYHFKPNVARLQDSEKVFRYSKE